MAASMTRMIRFSSHFSPTRISLTQGTVQPLASTTTSPEDAGSDTSQGPADVGGKPTTFSQPKRKMRKLWSSSEDSFASTGKIFVSPELLPAMGRRFRLLDYLSRLDCYRRRVVIDIPEFYVGSLLAVTVSDPYAKGKSSRFVGICIKRSGYGTGGTFTLRNVVDGEGVEICYYMYNPLITKIECLKLEKRLDKHLLYLRDALPEYSTVDNDMKAIKLPPGKPVPVNDEKVKMKPRPWYMRWERKELQGIDFSILSDEKMEEAKERWRPEHVKMDILQRWELPDDYFRQIEWEVTQHEREKRLAKEGDNR